MEIGLVGSGWRRQLLEDVLGRAGLLAGYVDGLTGDLVLVCGDLAGRARELIDFIKQGGRAIVLQPEKEIAALFGEELFYTHHFPLLHTKKSELGFSFLQVFPPITLIHPKEGEIWANFSLDFSNTARTGISSYPAVLWRPYGRGKVGLFLYDFLATILLLQEGREFFSSTGDFPLPVKDGVFRATYLQYGLINPELASIPQAYLQELLLLHLARKLIEEISPLPRLWCYPYPHTTSLVLSGDSDSLTKEKLKEAWQKLEEWGVPYTQFIMPGDLANFSSEELKDWEKRGIDFGLHYYAGGTPGPEEMRKHIAEARELFRQKKLAFDSARGHSLIWVGWDEQVKIMEENSLKVSSNLGYWYWGVTQGVPYPLYTKQGRSKVWEFQVFCTDDATVYDKSGHLPLSAQEARRKMTASLGSMQEIYYQPVTPVFHPHYFTGAASVDSTEWLKGTIDRCRQSNIPVFSMKQFVQWWNRRNESSGRCEIRGNQVNVDLPSSNSECAVALPEKWQGRNLRHEGKRLNGTGEILIPVPERKAVLQYE